MLNHYAAREICIAEVLNTFFFLFLFLFRLLNQKQMSPTITIRPNPTLEHFIFDCVALIAQLLV